MTTDRTTSTRTPGQIAALGAALVTAALILSAVPSGAAGTATTARLSGADRYATSAAISRASFQAGVSTVFVASGEDFPDALAVGAAAGAVEAPVLLTKHGVLPASVEAEIDRLNPGRIVVVGGPAAVSNQVVLELRDHSRSVTRIAGSDRYETAAKISAAYFDIALDNAFVASGADFPDAVSAAAIGAALHAPMLLTAPNRLPDTTADELERIDARRIMILGGSAAIDEATAEDVEEFIFAQVLRVAGADRYETSAQLSSLAYQHRTADTVYLASGSGFADAVAGAPVAGMNDSPILLVDGDRPTQAVCNEVSRLEARHVVALGGTGAVSNEVLRYVAEKCAAQGSAVQPGTDPVTSPSPTPGVPVPGGDTPPDQDITCSSFQTQSQAQAFHDYWLGKGFSDYYDLDDDGDGVACESLIVYG
ncbi:MAG: cell wall-binding repeat-containing protein [Actinobacteria bacterium]|nr:cell wall-binding repeat-containing protein [Actinomycetota bacterium]